MPIKRESAGCARAIGAWLLRSAGRSFESRDSPFTTAEKVTGGADTDADDKTDEKMVLE